jgi:hypothetical protein
MKIKKAVPNTLEVEIKCHMKIRKPGQGFWGLKARDPLKSKKPAQALWRLIPHPSACFCFWYVLGDLTIASRSSRPWLADSRPPNRKCKDVGPSEAE